MKKLLLIALVALQAPSCFGAQTPAHYNNLENRPNIYTALKNTLERQFVPYNKKPLFIEINDQGIKKTFKIAPDQIELLKTLKNMEEDYFALDVNSLDFEPISQDSKYVKLPPIHNLSYLGTELLLKYIRTKNPINPRNLTNNEFIALVNAADFFDAADYSYLDATGKTHLKKLYTTLIELVGALLCRPGLNLKTFVFFIENLNRPIVVEALQDKKMSLILEEYPSNRSLKNLLGPIKVTILQEKKLWDDSISIADIAHNPKTKHLLNLSSSDMPHHLNLTYRCLTSLDGVKDIKRIPNLHLSNNQITEIAPDTFNGLSTLQGLNLGYNKITDIAPGAFNGLPALQNLHLNYNKITDITPGAFNGLPTLQDLHLNYNKITNIAPGTFNGLSTLQNLHLYNNEITGIAPGAFNGLSTLQNLHLYNNEITGIAPGAFNGLPALQNLHLNYNKITNIASGTFNGLPTLQNLWLQRNAITNIAPGAFNGLPALQSLFLNYNKITDIAPGAFSILPQLRNLYLYENPITTIIPENPVVFFRINTGLNSDCVIHWGI